MSLTIHDLRVSLRDKMKTIDDLERKLKEMKDELSKKNLLLSETEQNMKKKDDIISMKDLIIKEKDTKILQLENQLLSFNSGSNNNKNSINSTQNISTNKLTINTTVSKIPKSNDSNNTSQIIISNKNKKADQVNYLELPVADASHQFTLKSKRIAISAESATNRYNKVKESIASLKEYDKSNNTKEFLKNAVFENDFMKNLELDQIESIVDCMYPVDFNEDSLIIKEGDVGNVVYIIEEGKCEVSKGNKVLCTISSGKVFGELAILYNCTRTASIRALSECKLWAIDRTTFQAIMMRFGMEKHNDYMELLKNTPIFQDIREDILTKYIDVFDYSNYNNEEFIIRQYAKGDTFFIISKGRAKITKSNGKWDEPKFVKFIERGDFFGESALFGEETREFNVQADDINGVSCLVLDRHTYNQFFNDSPQTNLKRQESTKLYRRAQTNQQLLDDECEEPDYSNVRLSEFEILGTLGVGGFGRVELVRNSKDLHTYALKVLKKQHIVQTKQQDHVLNERNIMFEARSKFICRLYKTFKDKKYLYLLLEVCLGGELWTILKDRGNLEEYDTKFYTACVMEAFSYLHSKGIVYRDLKPENLILDAKGYCKLVDFGFAKKIGVAKKTWTFCGTPEYVAPEIILNKGHDIAADYWSLGVLIFEFLYGNPPFAGNDPMGTYNIILKGIEAVDFPRKIPKTAAALIKRLCKENPVDRIGYQRGGIKDIQKHKWFEGFSWENLRKGDLEAPYIPKLKDNKDLSNFDSYPDDNSSEPEDDLTGWDQTF